MPIPMPFTRSPFYFDRCDECTIKFVSYNGLSWPPRTDSAYSARQRVASILKLRRKQGYLCRTLSRGFEWEILSPDDATIIDDRNGLLWLAPVPENAYTDDF